MGEVRPKNDLSAVIDHLMPFFLTKSNPYQLKIESNFGFNLDTFPSFVFTFKEEHFTIPIANKTIAQVTVQLILYRMTEGANHLDLCKFGLYSEGMRL